MSAAVGPRIAHTHVQRPVAHEGEAALGLIQLHRRDADIEDSAVQLSLAALGEGLRQSREGGADQLELARPCGGDRVGVRLDGRVAVQTDDLGAALQNGAGIAAGAEGGVDDHVAGLRVQGFKNFGQQDGGVRRRHAAPPVLAAAA